METKFPSTDGAYIFQIFPWEARMSLWIETPKLIHVASGKCLLEFRDGNWSLDRAQWDNAQTVVMTLRKYPGDHCPSSLEVIVDCEKMQASIMGAPPIALDALESALDELIQNTAVQLKPAKQSMWQALVAQLRGDK